MHIITLRGRDYLLSVHCTTRYTFTMFDLTAADWHAFPGTFLRGLNESLRDAGVAKSAVRRYLQTAGTLELSKTYGRREVAFLNRAWSDTLAMDIAIDPMQQYQLLLNDSVNNLPRRCAGFDGIGTATDRLRYSLQ